MSAKTVVPSIYAVRFASVPQEVGQAQGMVWGVPIDAYLADAARVGDRFVAKAYADLSHRIADGSTITTPPVRLVRAQGSFRLIQSVSGHDHYVIVSDYAA